MIRQLFAGCWLHHDWIRERDAQERLILRCERCQTVHRPDLSKDTYRGSAHQPAEVLGVPNTRVRTHAERSKIIGRVG